MSGVSRRRFLQGSAIATTAALLGARAAQAQTGQFAPPAGPMRYTRRLERELADGARIVVERSFSVRFHREGDGFRVDGVQVGIAVDGPESLASFLAMERDRQELSLFPLWLDAAGALRDAPGEPVAGQLDAAVREAMAQLQVDSRSPAERAELGRFLAAMQQSAGRVLTDLPRDLFSPPDGERVERRAVALAGGLQGEVRVRFAATRDPLTGLMREARRTVVTELGADRRETVESWQLVEI